MMSLEALSHEIGSKFTIEYNKCIREGQGLDVGGNMVQSVNDRAAVIQDRREGGNS